MEQRALLASALVLGCVTVAGAGGYIATRQPTSPAADAAVPAPVVDDDAAAVEGTVADIEVRRPSAGGVRPQASPSPEPRADQPSASEP